MLVWALIMPVLGSRGPMLSGALACAGSALAILLVPAQAEGGRTVLLLALGLNGLLANAVQTSMFALSAHIYPLDVRASGVAYGTAIGRVGGLVSSLFGAVIIGAGAAAYWGVLAATMVCAFAGLAWVRSHIPALTRQERWS